MKSKWVLVRRTKNLIDSTNGDQTCLNVLLINTKWLFWNNEHKKKMMKKKENNDRRYRRFVEERKHNWWMANVLQRNNKTYETTCTRFVCSICCCFFVIFFFFLFFIKSIRWTTRGKSINVELSKHYVVHIIFAAICDLLKRIHKCCK